MYDRKDKMSTFVRHAFACVGLMAFCIASSGCTTVQSPYGGQASYGRSVPPSNAAQNYAVPNHNAVAKPPVQMQIRGQGPNTAPPAANGYSTFDPYGSPTRGPSPQPVQSPPGLQVYGTPTISTPSPRPTYPVVPAQATQTYAPTLPSLPPPPEFNPVLPGPAETVQPLQVYPDGGTADIDVIVEETQTGRFMFGVGVNSDLGVTGQIVIDERNFDITRIPTSFSDFVNGTAFRGAGQGFRMEAMPGSQVQRYLVSFSEPYLLNGRLPFSLNVSGFFYDRRFFDWDEQRLGGRVALGYRVTHDLSLSTAIRGENVNIHDPRVSGVQELDSVLGDNTLMSGRVALTHDTRDVPFAATQGHFLELSYEQVFGSFDYPRAEIDYRRYFLVRERPDGSGRHSLSMAFRGGFSGAQTPIFENYFAGGHSTLRGFDFRGASPLKGGVQVGGEFRFLGSVEYLFPLTADDMIKGVFFCDFGTVEEQIEVNAENYRVAPGFGLRISIPAMGPAPLALDFAVPVARAKTDDIQNFSFFFGFGR